MRTPEQCRAKADGLEREARAAESDLRREAYLELAEHWRRLAERYETGLDRLDPVRLWPQRKPRLN